MAATLLPDGSGTTTKLSPRSVEETVSRLTELIKSKRMKVFAVIDQSAEASSVGLNLRATVLVLFGSPAAGTPVMEAAPLSAMDLPLKILVWEDESQTKVSYVAPQVLAGRYSLTPELSQKAGWHHPPDQRFGRLSAPNFASDVPSGATHAGRWWIPPCGSSRISLLCCAVCLRW
jgi:uncharacterized protein (DUF302 family)